MLTQREPVLSFQQSSQILPNSASKWMSILVPAAGWTHKVKRRVIWIENESDSSRQKRWKEVAPSAPWKVAALRRYIVPLLRDHTDQIKRLIKLNSFIGGTCRTCSQMELYWKQLWRWCIHSLKKGSVSLFIQYRPKDWTLSHSMCLLHFPDFCR